MTWILLVSKLDVWIPVRVNATLPGARSGLLARLGSSSVPNSDLGGRVKLLIIAENYLKLGRLFSF